MRLPPCIQGVTFDVGGTLIECCPSVGHIYAEVAFRHTGKSFDPALLNRRFAAAWKAASHFQHRRSDWAALVDATFLGLTDVPPSATFFPELYDVFAQPAAWHVFADVVPALTALEARGLKLGIVSNWDERLRLLLEGLGLQPRFQAVAISCEIGCGKPSVAIFNAAAAGLGLAPERILHVGDDVAKDLLGARAAGFQARLLQRRGAGRLPGALRSLDELAPGRRRLERI